MSDDRCPICDQDVPCTHAIEWDCEPAPGSEKWGMSVCEVCAKGVEGILTGWDWVAIIVQRERKTTEELRRHARAIEKPVEDLLRIVIDGGG